MIHFESVDRLAHDLLEFHSNGDGVDDVSVVNLDDLAQSVGAAHHEQWTLLLVQGIRCNVCTMQCWYQQFQVLCRRERSADRSYARHLTRVFGLVTKPAHFTVGFRFASEVFAIKYACHKAPVCASNQLQSIERVWCTVALDTDDELAINELKVDNLGLVVGGTMSPHGIAFDLNARVMVAINELEASNCVAHPYYEVQTACELRIQAKNKCT